MILDFIPERADNKGSIRGIDMSARVFRFTEGKQPVVIAGPCMAESEDLISTAAGFLVQLANELDFQLVFKSSFDKANRTAGGSFRGPGIELTQKWFSDLKSKYNGLPILTDIHETHHAAPIAEVCDVLQIPAFLCRQTDLLVAAVETGRSVNVKKGQFLAPTGAHNIVDKARAAATAVGRSLDLALTERGTSFGYGDLIVDPRSFSMMAMAGVPVIFDVTHSLQQPAASGSKDAVSGGLREFAPMLTRAAIATGYVSGLFLEVHPDPKNAKSDAATQLSFEQAKALLSQVVPQLKKASELRAIDQIFKSK
jgi:2-dehydro-3-deoxyphosphooctonate aldolase (KDO 8-P synthase)